MRASRRLVNRKSGCASRSRFQKDARFRIFNCYCRGLCRALVSYSFWRLPLCFSRRRCRLGGCAQARARHHQQAYPDAIGALENTHRDGERIAATLKALGFAVSHRRDLDKASMVTAIADYVDRLEKAGPEAVGFFYYAGHGAANSKYGDNYLIPIQAPIISGLPTGASGRQARRNHRLHRRHVGQDQFSRFRRLPKCADDVLCAICNPRSSPRGASARHADRLRHRSGQDRDGRGRLRRSATEEMQKPGVLATEVFRAVRSRVLAATENKQFPWIEDGLIDNMYFKPPSGQLPPSPSPSHSASKGETKDATQPVQALITRCPAAISGIAGMRSMPAMATASRPSAASVFSEIETAGSRMTKSVPLSRC